MKIEEGVARSVSNGKAVIEISNISSEECARCGVCVTAGDTTRLLDVESIPGLEVGDRVTLKIDSPSPYKGISLLFFLPIMAFIVGCIVAAEVDFILPESENARMGITGLLFFLVSLGLAGLYDRRVRSKDMFPPEILSIENKRLDAAEEGYAEGYQ